MTVKKLCVTCQKLFYCKSNLNRHVKKFHGSDRQQNRHVNGFHGNERQQDKKEPKNNYTLRLFVTVKKSNDEIKTILQDPTTIMKLNLRAELQKAELVDQQVLIHCNGVLMKSLIDAAHRWLGPMMGFG